jgi:FAD-linked oxidoreductase
MPTRLASRQWKNWAGNQRATPAAIETPSSEEEIVAIVRDAAAAGERVKMVGAGHSFTAIAVTDGRLIRPDNFQRVLSVDRTKRLVTVQAGIRLSTLNAELAKRGLAMPNLGDIEYQSIAGAISTATHGTGIKLGGLATFVVGMRIISGDGSVIECDAEHEPELFHTARVGLGALGVLSTVTLQCEEAFNVHAVESAAKVDELLDSLDDHIAENDHFEFFWIPNTEWALTKWNNRTEKPLAPRSRWKEFRDDVLIGNGGFSLGCRIARLAPSLTPRIMGLVPFTGRAEYIDRSDKVYTSPRLVHFYEMEYSIERSACREALNRVRQFVSQSGIQISFPVEVRFTAGDDIPLSTAYARENCYIAVHVYSGTHYQQYFEAVETIMNDYGGRPHWGKLHFQTHRTLRDRYPEWERFQAVRKRLDPEGRFSNPYLERVLGPLH